MQHPAPGTGIALPFALSFLAPNIRFEDPPNPNPGGGTPPFDAEKFIDDLLKKIPSGLQQRLQTEADKNDAGWQGIALMFGDELKTLREKFREMSGATEGALVITDAAEKEAISKLKGLLKADGRKLTDIADIYTGGRDAQTKLAGIERDKSVTDTLGEGYNVDTMRQLPGFGDIEFSKIEVPDPNNEGKNIVQRQATYEVNGAKVTKSVDDMIADKWPAFKPVLIKTAEDANNGGGNGGGNPPVDQPGQITPQRTVPVQGGGGNQTPAPGKPGVATGEAAEAIKGFSADSAQFFPGGLGDGEKK